MNRVHIQSIRHERPTPIEAIQASIQQRVRAGALDGPDQRDAACDGLAQEFHLTDRQAHKLFIQYAMKP